jgi:hypothetical protein
MPVAGEFSVYAPVRDHVTLFRLQFSVMVGALKETTALQLLPFVFVEKFAGQLVITGGVVSPTFTVIVVCEEQPLAVAVIVKTVVTMVFGAELFIMPAIGVPVPLSSPVKTDVLSRVHEKFVPVTLFGLVRTMLVMAWPGQAF